MFKELKTHLKFPNIFLLMLSVYTLKVFLNVLENKDYVTITFILLILVYSSFHFYKTKKTIKNRYNTTGKKWLFDVSIMQLGGFIHLSFLLIQIPNFKDYLMLQTNIGGLVFSIIFVSYIMIIYISSCVVPKIIEENMKKRYQDLYF